MLTLTVTVKSKDLGFDKIMRRASRFKRGVTTTAGIQGTKAIAKKPKHGGKSSTSLSRVTNVQAAFWNEYGAPGANPPIPQRSFLRSTYDKKENKYLKLFGIALVKSLFASSRKGIIKEINDVGDEYIRDVQKAIFARISPPNTLSTLSKKSRRAAPIIKDVKSKFGHKKTVRQSNSEKKYKSDRQKRRKLSPEEQMSARTRPLIDFGQMINSFTSVTTFGFRKDAD